VCPAQYRFGRCASEIGRKLGEGDFVLGSAAALDNEGTCHLKSPIIAFSATVSTLPSDSMPTSSAESSS
jgi:hypothetical protein